MLISYLDVSITDDSFLTECAKRMLFKIAVKLLYLNVFLWYICIFNP